MFVGRATAYHSFLKLSNLFVPVGTRLAPPVRRDAIRSALALESDRIVWLHPLGEGAFRAESLPASAFRPLPEWIDYRAGEPLRKRAAWVQSFRWELTPFVERPEPKPRLPSKTLEIPEPAAKPKAVGGILSRTLGLLRKGRLQRPLATPAPEDSPPSIPVDEAVKIALDQGHRLHLARPETMNSGQERCRTLEARILQNLPTLASEDHTELWSELAAAHDAVRNHSDAALCWLNALWGRAKPSPLWAWGWVRAEAKAARSEVKTIDPQPWLARSPSAGTTRTLAAWIVWASLQSPHPPALRERSAELVARLEEGEHWLPVRAAWLSRTAITRATSVDALGLARTRDRLSERLLAGGLSLETDTPSFLRFAGDGVRERFHEARKWLKEKRELIHHWIAQLPERGRYRPSSGPGSTILRRVGLEAEVAHTRAYADLILAWGLTRFAEYSEADHLRNVASAALPLNDPVHAILRDAFEFRIQQVREGKRPQGPLPDGLIRRMESLRYGRYAVDKWREHSRLLEPTTCVDGFDASIYGKADRRSPTLAQRVMTLPADRLDEEVEKLVASERDRNGRKRLGELTAAILNRASELNESGAAAMFEALLAALESSRSSPAILARLIEKGLAAAALWDRSEIARLLVGRLLQLVDEQSGWDIAEGVISQAVRSLRRLGLKVDADMVLFQIAERVLQGQPIGRLRATRPDSWPTAIRVLLHAAAGWYFAGNDDNAHKILEEASKDLFASETTAPNRTKLALAYATTLAQAPARIAFGRLEEIFQRLGDLKLDGSTNEFYSLQPLLLIEAAVRAVVSDEFSVGPQVRAWLDADELAVRRRIRDELKDALAGQDL